MNCRKRINKHNRSAVIRRMCGGPPSDMRRRALGSRIRSGPGRQDPRYHVGHVAKNRQKLTIFSQNVLKCSCNIERNPEKLVLCSIGDLF